MPNYSNGKIYKIVNDENDKVYIGSTCQKLFQRLAKHKYRSKDKSRANGLYPAMRQLGVENFRIVLIKETPCSTKAKLEELEYKVIEKYTKRGDKLYNLNGGKGKDNHMYGTIGKSNNKFNRGCLEKKDTEYPRWIFTWYVEKKRRSKSFSVIKYGNKGAYKLAKEIQDEIYPLSDSE